MKSFKNKFKSPFKDRWNNLIRAGANEAAYALFLATYPSFTHIHSKDRIKYYKAALKELGLIS